MRRWLISLGLVFAVPGLALPQTVKIQADIEKELQQTRIYEDIEIMRRLLQRRIVGFMNSCQKCHATVAGEPSLPSDPFTSTATEGSGKIFVNERNYDTGIVGSGRVVWHPDGGGRVLRTASSDTISLDGVYIPGQGVILQAHLPPWVTSMTREPRGQAPKKPAETINDWDLIRRQIRGEKIEGRSGPADDPHEVTIQDVLVRALAEYGKHIRLAENERLTLAVTFRHAAGDQHASSVRYSAVEALAAIGDVDGGPAAGIGLGDKGGGGPTSSGLGPMGPKGSGGGPMGPPSSSRDYELLADLHIKQGRYQEAIKTLRKAAEINSDPNRHVSIYRKLASAQLLLNQSDPSQKTLDEVMELLQKAKASAKAGAAPPAPRLYLPQRLTITASQPALQKATTSNLDAFRSQISLVWLRFDHPVLGGGGGDSGAGSLGSGSQSK
jgi:tetratricopeptide (TPR) repeat protein